MDTIRNNKNLKLEQLSRMTLVIGKNIHGLISRWKGPWGRACSVAWVFGQGTSWPKYTAR